MADKYGSLEHMGGNVQFHLEKIVTIYGRNYYARWEGRDS